MNRISFFLVVFFIFHGFASSAQGEIKFPADSSRPGIRNIVVTIDSSQQFYLGSNKISRNSIDSLLTAEIEKYKTTTTDLLVVISADSAALYGDVFQVMMVAKKAGAKVVANIRR